MTGRLHTIWLVATFDFFESLRSKKALGLVAMYLAGSLAATGIFINVLRAIEKVAAEQLRVAQTSGAGAMTSEVLRSEQFLQVLDELVGEPELARSLVSMPPLALFYAWVALTFIPLLVTLTSGDSISWEVSNGSVRFALFRTARLPWAIGKLLGQAMLMTAGIVAGGIGSYVLASFYMNEFPYVATAWWLVRFSGRAWVYGFAYLGLAMAASQLTRSVNWSRALAVMLLFGFAVAGNLLETGWLERKAPTIVPTLAMLFPQGHDLDLWRPALADRLPGFAMLLALGCGYFAIGYARFARRDQ